MVSPAPPSNSTLSGTTTAARPVVFSIVRMCWTKLSCLFDVVAQKVLPVVGQVVGLLLAVSIREAHGTLLPEGRIGQDVVETS